MRKNKYFILITLVISLALIVVGCGGGGGDQAVVEEKEETTEKTTEKQETATEEEKKTTEEDSKDIQDANLKQAAELKEKVDAGELPPLEQRLPKEPMVIEPEDKIGKYGGNIQLTQFGNNSLGIPGHVLSEAPMMFNRDFDNLETIGNFIKEWEFSNEGKHLTLNIREGVKWSDGEPLTADDFMFWFNDVMQNEEITPSVPGWLKPGGEIMEVEAADDYTLEFSFKVPYYGFIDWLNSYWYRGIDSFLPDHYLKKYHIKYNSDAPQLAEEEGFDTWVQLFDSYNSGGFTVPKPVGRPRLSAWIVKDVTSTGRIYERNPYYWKVDSEGNQLPYIDKIKTIITSDAETRKLKVLAGNVDYISSFLSLEDYPTLKSSEDSGGYDAWIGDSIWASRVTLAFQQNYLDDEVMSEILSNKKFRQALSIGIDREEINELVFLGQGEPRQLSYTPGTVSTFKDEWANSYADYNPEKAKEMLDEIGLVDDDGDGWRERPDGDTLLINLTANSSRAISVDTAELARDYWEDLGVKINLKTVEEGTLWQRVWNGKTQISTQFMTGAAPPWDQYNPRANTHFTWGNWLDYYDVFNEEIGDIPEDAEAEKPPEEIIKWFTWGEKLPHVSVEEKEELMNKIGDYVAENLPAIGTVGMTGHVGVSNKGLGNVRKVGDNPSVAATRNAYLEQFYWEDEERRRED
ncbi:MAG: ABC transporter substrate-binding protein [Bacillota bacterium]